MTGETGLRRSSKNLLLVLRGCELSSSAQQMPVPQRESAVSRASGSILSPSQITL